MFEELFFRNVVDECDWHVGIGESEGRHICEGWWAQRGDEMACETLTSAKHLVNNIVEGWSLAIKVRFICRVNLWL